MALPSNKDRIKAAKRRRKALFLRGQGYTIAEIADALGCSNATVSKTINTAVRNYNKESNDLVKRLVVQESEILNELYRQVFPKVVKRKRKDDKGQWIDEISYRAVDKILAIHDRKCRLHGLNKAEQVVVSGEIELGSPEEAKDALLAKLREKSDARK